MSSSAIKIDRLYVVDTHALIWYLINDSKLGDQAAQVFAAAERGETRLIVSAIVIAEMYYANRKNKWFPDFNATYRQLRTRSYFRFVHVKADHMLDFDKDASVPEMHDRMIAGLARRLNAPILTADSQITNANLARIVW
jgi:PIN domain nuclease of toxin-antitoxin system